MRRLRRSSHRLEPDRGKRQVAARPFCSRDHIAGWPELAYSRQVPELAVPVEVARVLREFLRRLRDHFGAKLHEVRLFGSYARGSAHEASDIDVLVLLDRLDYQTQRAVLDIAGDLFVETNLLLSPTVFEEATYRQHVVQERPLASDIERQGALRMTAEGRQEVVSEELRVAGEELAAADQLIAITLYRIAMTRLYFATFHAARAVSYAQGYDLRTHQGVLTLFNQHLVRPGHLGPLAARVLARLQKYREQADYGESFVVDLEGVREEAAAARQFVERADQFARQSLSGQP
jgi:uncharacterized protein (UPF0332 family)/predicted nucleotidyltransferase